MAEIKTKYLYNGELMPLKKIAKISCVTFGELTYRIYKKKLSLYEALKMKPQRKIKKTALKLGLNYG